LDLAEVLGYQVVTGKGRWESGMLGVYFPADTILTDEWAKTFEVDHLLKSDNRVGRCRLRGEASFGLVVGIPEGQDWELGQNVADFFDAKKWEPDPDKATAPDAAPYDSEIDPLFVKYTDIQNGLLLYNKFVEGEEVVATEKIHGKNCRIGLVNGTTQVGSRTTRKNQERKGSIFWDAADLHNVRGLLDNIWNDQEAFNAKTVIVYGEIYGQGVQSLHYGCNKKKGFRAFDIYVNGDFLDYDTFVEQCKLADVEMAPVLYRGPFDLAKIKEVSNGKSTLPGAKNIREGVVVRTVKERRDPALGRVVLKFISTEYDLSKHKKKDTTDV
jgi:RNA ligase (TIGR02306 family)